MNESTKLDGAIVIEEPNEVRTLEEALSTIYVLWIRKRSTSALIGWWYHPNREALEEKRDALSGDGYAAEIVRYIREDLGDDVARR